MSERQRALYVPHVIQTAQDWFAHGQDVTGGRRLLALPYRDATDALAVAKAKIMGWDKRSHLKDDHLRRIGTEVDDDVKRYLDAFYSVEVPGIGAKKTSGGILKDLIFTIEDEYPMGWAEPIGRPGNGELGRCRVYANEIVVGTLTEVPPTTIKNPDRKRSAEYEGEITWPDGTPRQRGRFMLARLWVYACDAALTPAELRFEQERLEASERGLLDRKQRLHRIEGFVEQESTVLLPGRLRNLDNISEAQGVDTQAVVRQILVDFYGAASA
jgi:hypothetical protein